jgi:hypothetical protein
MTDTPPAPITPAQADAQVALDTILADKDHPYYLPGHPGSAQAVEDVLALRRAVAGDANRVVVAYREPGDEPRPAAPMEPLTITREDVTRMAPASWAPPQVARVVTIAMDKLGATPLELSRIFAITASPPPPPERELDLVKLWGDDADRNVKLVNGLLTRIQTHDTELHDRLLPYVQRHAGAAEHLLAVARRLASRR